MPGVVTIISADGRSQFSFDGEESIGIGIGASVTQLPVEDGSPVSDHSQRDNNQITVQALTTNTPFDSPTTVGSARRTQDIADLLEAILGEPVTLVIASRQLSRTYDNVVLSSMPHDIGGLDELSFDLRFDQIRLAEAQLVSIPPERPPAPRPPAPGVPDESDKKATVPDEQDVGEQPPKKELPPKKAAEDDRSYLAKAIDGDLF